MNYDLNDVPRPRPTASKGFQAGTHRVVAPAETLTRARKLFGPLGITRVANVTGLDCIGVPVVMVCRPNARSLAVSQGKGLDLESARVSGVMESIELYHAERITHALKLASWKELRALEETVAVDGLPLISVSAFHPDRALLWIEGTDLVDGRSRWLPFELVHTNYTLPFPTGTGCFVMSSNGLASGNDLREALCHALCEVIERDASALHNIREQAEQETRRIDLETVDDPACKSVLDLYKRAGISVGVWDMTSDVSVAAFRCVIVDRTENAFRHLGAVEGMGCHPTREIALLRALTEAAQARLTLIAGSRDDNGQQRYARARRPMFSEPARRELAELARRPFGDVPSHVTDTFDEDLAWLVERLRAVGLTQIVVVDLTRRELGIPVVRVVVPGLETYHRAQGYLPGRRARSLIDTRLGKTP